MNVLVFVRHGETDANKARRLLGDGDPPLNQDGLRESAQCADWILSVVGTPDIILTSPKLRALQTASVIAECAGKSAQADDRLLERRLGPYDGLEQIALRRVREDRGHSFRDITQDWSGIAEVEQDSAVAERALAATDIDFNKNQRVILVTHAGVIKSVFHTIFSIAPIRQGILKIRNGGAMVLAFRADGIAIEALFNPRILT